MVIVTADSNQYFSVFSVIRGYNVYQIISVFSVIRGYNVYQIIWTPRGRKDRSSPKTGVSTPPLLNSFDITTSPPLARHLLTISYFVIVGFQHR